MSLNCQKYINISDSLQAEAETALTGKQALAQPK